jgi:hypothetical protein
MVTLSALGARELIWRYPRKENQAFELCAAGEEFGWLRFEDPAGVRATGELNGQRYTFRHSGGAHPCVFVANEDSTPVAEFVPRLTGGGTVSFANGARYCWNRAKIWSTQWCFRKEGQTSSICLSQQAGALTEGGKVNVCGKAAQVPETAVLVLLAWYLRVLAFETLVEAIPVVG